MFRRFLSRRSALALATAATLASGTTLQVGSCGATVDQLSSNLLGTGAWEWGAFSWGWDRRDDGGGTFEGEFGNEP